MDYSTDFVILAIEKNSVFLTLFKPTAALHISMHKIMNNKTDYLKSSIRI